MNSKGIDMGHSGGGRPGGGPKNQMVFFSPPCFLDPPVFDPPLFSTPPVFDLDPNLVRGGTQKVFARA
jgi:hypothetical protein